MSETLDFQALSMHQSPKMACHPLPTHTHSLSFNDMHFQIHLAVGLQGSVMLRLMAEKKGLKRRSVVILEHMENHVIEQKIGQSRQLCISEVRNQCMEYK